MELTASSNKIIPHFFVLAKGQCCFNECQIVALCSVRRVEHLVDGIEKGSRWTKEHVEQQLPIAAHRKVVVGGC